MERKLKYPGTINIFHIGCWASDLTKHFIEILQRPDLELFVFLRNTTRDTYEALAIIRSRERKVIERDLRSKIMLYLLGHDVVRVVDHVNTLEFSFVLYLTVWDEKTKGVIRHLPATAVVNQDIGMPVYDGIESVIAYYNEPADFFKAIEMINQSGLSLSKFHSKKGFLKEWEMREAITYPEGLLNEPTFILNLLKDTLDEEKSTKLTNLLKAGSERISELVEFVSENLPGLIPILLKIIAALQRWRNPNAQ